jgi:hypothetical protein
MLFVRVSVQEKQRINQWINYLHTLMELLSGLLLPYNLPINRVTVPHECNAPVPCQTL